MTRSLRDKVPVVMSFAASGGRPLRVCIASHYGYGAALYNRLVFEACAAIATMADATIVAPGPAPMSKALRTASLAKHAVTGAPLCPIQPVTLEEDFDLFLFVAMRPQDLVCLDAIKGWRGRSRKAAAFLFETWSALVHEKRAYYRRLDQFDEVFLFNAASVEHVQKVTTARCSHLPAAVDCLAATPYPRPAYRPIDVFTMGRTDQTVHEQLVEMTRKQELLYLWDLPPGAMTASYDEARFRTYNLIRSSRLFTSFNFKIAATKDKESRGEDTIPARVFEGAAAGAVMIGTAPTVPEYAGLFDWEDALIEMPLDPVDVSAFYAELQANPDRLRRASILNAAQSLRRHDWVYRWEEMLRQLDLPAPPAVTERKARLAALAALADNDLGLRIVSTG